jgi:hypothetical protein
MNEPTPLTQSEISRLNWTDQIRFAQGKLSTEEAREKLALKSSNAKNLTEQCLEVTGGKDQIHRGQ